ncbi:MAG: hypothetical protein D4R73_10790 [Deltaproteobacteria bacterium]|nr:MAG: hypothetical protein D4R73_10790 [Deltaproteobacteria bacterium]
MKIPLRDRRSASEKNHVFVIFTDKNIEGLFILHKTVRVKPRPCLTSSRTSVERYPVSEK